MTLRVTPRLGIEFATTELGKQAAELQRTQQQISTGLRLHRPSDDPAAVRRAIVQKDELSRLQTNVESVQQVKARVGKAHVQLREAQQLFVQARSVALSAAQATEPAEIEALASELDGILNQLISLANASDENGFLFSGTATQSKPFEVNRETGAVTYSGTSAHSELHLAGDVPRDALVSGDRIFRPTDRQEPFLLGTTGVTAAQAIGTATGRRSLTIEHTLTTYQGPSGIAAGISSANGDTIVGALGTHQLQVADTSGTGAFGTVSLNNGATINFASTDTDLLVRGPSGEEVFIDVSALTAGFSGTVDIVADGTLSVDGGVTPTAINFDNNEVFVDSRDGSTVILNTNTLQSQGVDEVEFIGTTDAFQVLIDLREDLRNSRNLLTQDRVATFDRRIADVERIENHLLNEIGIQGVALQQFERLEVRTEDQTLEQRIRYGETTNADLAQAAVRLQELLNLQQFTTAAVSRLQSQNLLDFLR